LVDDGLEPRVPVNSSDADERELNPKFWCSAPPETVVLVEGTVVVEVEEVVEVEVVVLVVVVDVSGHFGLG
jgi:hypothetical protein